MYMRDRFNAPIVWTADAGGSRCETVGTKDRIDPEFEPAGLGFSDGEAYTVVMRPIS